MKWIIEKIENNSAAHTLVFEDVEFTYQQLAFEISNLYSQISVVIPKGRTVAILSDYSFQAVAVFFALYENNNIVVPIISKIETDIKEKVHTALCDFIIKLTAEGLQFEKTEFNDRPYDLVNNLVNKARAGLILFSSGSTGKPKAMIHDLDNLVDSFKYKRGKGLNFLVFLMFDHIGGLNTLLNCVSMGVTMVLPANRNPIEICRLIDKYNINILPASPTFLNLVLLSEAYTLFSLNSLKLITYGTEPMPESLLTRLRQVFPKVKFLQTFGTSETGISQMSSKSSTSTLMKFEDSNTETKIVNGELYIRSKTQILGYLNFSMERFTEDGWFRTGDLVEPADNGYFRIVGRNSEVINVGGEKVLPSEVESVLYQNEKVMDCIVYGESNPITGQMVVAKILYSENISLMEVKREIRSFCKDKLAAFKIPAKILLIGSSEYSDRFKKRRI